MARSSAQGVPCNAMTTAASSARVLKCWPPTRADLWDTAKISAKKWGDTEIAERGRSVLVMRTRYRSAGFIPHQRGWTDAG